jgi:hypothetical protein
MTPREAYARIVRCPDCRVHVDPTNHDDHACRAMREAREAKNRD